MTSIIQNRKDQNSHCLQWWTIHCLGLFLPIYASLCLTDPYVSCLPKLLRLLWASLTTCILKLKPWRLHCAAPQPWHKFPIRVSNYITNLHNDHWKILTSLGTGTLIPVQIMLASTFVWALLLLTSPFICLISWTSAKTFRWRFAEVQCAGGYCHAAIFLENVSD